MKKIITLNQDVNVGEVALQANTTILEFIALKEFDFINPVNFEELKELLQSNDVVFKFHLSEKEVETLSKHYDKYHNDNISVQLLKDVQEFNILNH